MYRSLPLAAFGLLVFSAQAEQSAGPVADASAQAETPTTIVVVGERSDDSVRADAASVGVLGDMAAVEAPYSINVINAHLLDIQQISTYGDFLKNVPGASTGNVTVGFLSLRGFSLGSDGYLYDGMPGHAAIGDTYQTDSTDRIEIFKGPGTFLAGFGGASSLGGTLNYLPKRAQGEPLTRIEAGYENRSQFTVASDLSRRFGEGERFGARLNLRVRDGEQAVEHYEWNQTAASLALDWDASSTLKMFSVFEYADNHLPTLPPFLILSPGLQPPEPGDTTANLAQSWDDYQSRGYSGYGRIDWSLAQDWTTSLQILSSVSERPKHKNARFGSIDNAQGDVTLFAGEENSETNSDSVQLSFRGKAQTGALTHRITLAYLATSETNRSSYGPIGAVATNLYAPVQAAEPPDAGLPLLLSSKSRSNSVVISDIVEFTPRWSVLLAARRAEYEQDNFSYATGTTRTATPGVADTSPTAAIMFKPVDDSLIYVSFGEGVEQGGEAPLGALNAGARLEALVTEQYELGFKLQRGGVLYTLALFDLLRPSEFVNAAGIYVQDGEQRHRGIELGANGRVLPGLDVVAGLSWIDPESESTGNPALDGNRPVSVPRFTGNLFLDYALKAVPGLYLNGGVYHNGKQFLDQANTQELDGWTRFDAGLRYQTRISDVSTQFILAAENISNEEYWIGEQGILTYADPMTLKFTSRFDF